MVNLLNFNMIFCILVKSKNYYSFSSITNCIYIIWFVSDFGFVSSSCVYFCLYLLLSIKFNQISFSNFGVKTDGRTDTITSLYVNFIYFENNWEETFIKILVLEW